jgi:Tfp pilus assembly protein PilO
MKQKIEFSSGYAKFKRYYRSLEPMLEKPQNRLYTAVIFSFLAIALFGWFAIKPTVQTIIYLQREIKDKSALNRQMEEKIEQLIQAQTSYEDAKGLLPVLDDAIPDSADALDAIIQIRNLVSTTQATLSSVRVSNIALVSANTQGKDTSPSKNEFLISITLNGIYQEVEAFLQAIQTMRRILTIEQINFIPEKDASTITRPTGKNIKLTVQLKAYYK